MAKTQKAPKPFEERTTPQRLEKRILKRIHVDDARDFARSLYVPDEATPGSLVFRAPDDKKARDRLKKLVKEVKKNRGFVQTGPMVVLLLVLGGWTAAAAVFKDSWVEAQMERALEGMFGARVDLEGFKLDIFGGVVRFRSLTVANKDEPMTNLFELGTTEFSLDPWQLLNKKVIIDTLEAQDLKVGTARTVTGELPPERRPVTPPPPLPPSTPPEPFAVPGLVDLGAFDAEALVQKELDKIKTLEVADRVTKELQAGTEAWEARLTEAEERIEGLEAGVKEVQAIRVDSLKTPEAVANALKTVQTVGTRVQGDIRFAEEAYRSARADYDKAGALVKEAQAAYEADLAYIREVVKDPGAFGANVALSAATQVLGPRAWEIHALAQEIPRFVGALQGPKVAPAPVVERRGRTVRFPSRTYPAFSIRRAGFSLWVDNDTRASLTVLNVSSDPELSPAGGPLSFELGWDDAAFAADFEGRVDLRETASNLVDLEVGLDRLDLDLGESLSGLGISSLRGRAMARVSVTVPRTGGTTMAAQVEVADLAATVPGQDLLGRVTRRVMDQASFVEVSARADFPPGGPAAFEATTNLDEIFAQAFRESMAAELALLQARAEEELKKILDEKLKEHEALYGLYQGYLTESDGSLTDVRAAQRVATAKQAELEALGQKYADQARAEAQRLVDEQLKKTGITVPPVTVPDIKLPTLPRRP